MQVAAQPLPVAFSQLRSHESTDQFYPLRHGFGLCGLDRKAVGSNEPLLPAQLQKDQKQPKVAGPAKNSVQNETMMPGCDQDRIALPAGETWCRRGTLYQCSTASNTWVGIGKKCP